MASNSHDRRKTVQLVDQKIKRGHGGETHQIAENEAPTLTSQQGVPIVDDQNSLRIGPRGPTALEDAPPRGLLQAAISYQGICRPVQCVRPTASFSE